MAVKNTLVDFHNIMMEQLERLNDTDLSSEELDAEIKRAESMASVGEVIVKNAANMINAQKVNTNAGEYVKPNKILLSEENEQ